MSSKPLRQTAPPPFRRLRVYAFDPSLSTSIENATFNFTTLRIPWESLQPGPVGEYLEVIDVDPASGLCYPPVDLEDPDLLAQDGCAPSESNPQFHQQMVYSVANDTIQNFEKALGRRVLWAVPRYAESGADRYQYIPRLRLYPHALREANAYYSPVKKAVLFGYFPASGYNPGYNLPGETVFTCLSHDIIAHEITHALLESLHPRFIEPSNIDVLALHEAFADIVALFQHFSHPNVLYHAIARARGDLDSENLLAELAQQFGQAIGSRGALRSALGGRDKQTGEWRRKQPDPAELRTAIEPHARGSLLVSAVFNAFLAIYKTRTADLLRIASGGSGILQPGALAPDLVSRLTDEAAKVAGHVLRMCIRALDYVPPVDITFGDYLRALVTADTDLVPEDRFGYRLAIIDAFRRHGIFPTDVRSPSEDSLLWDGPSQEDEQVIEQEQIIPSLKRLREMVSDEGAGLDRKKLFDQSSKNGRFLHNLLKQAREVDYLGLSLSQKSPQSIYRGKDGLPSMEVHSVRQAYRESPGGFRLTDLVVEITQRRAGYYDLKRQRAVDAGEIDPPTPDFIFRGGTTLLVSLETGKIRYAIYKRVANNHRLETQRRFLSQVLSPSLRVTYFGDTRQNFYASAGKDRAVEPFALLHRYEELEEGYE